MGVKHLWRTLEKGGAVELLDGAAPQQHDTILEELEGAAVAVDLSAWWVPLARVGACIFTVSFKCQTNAAVCGALVSAVFSPAAGLALAALLRARTTDAAAEQKACTAALGGFRNGC